MTEKGQLQFASVLASSIHDMKNSLGMVLNSLDGIVDPGLHQCRCTPEQVAQLQYEAKRINDNLIQLLTIYRMENAVYEARVDEVDVYDFLEEAFLQSKPMLEYRGVTADLACEPGLVWYFDRNLIAGVLDNIITNAMRYTKDRVRIGAAIDGEFLAISVEDNGRGFPVHMLEAGQHVDRDIDLVSGRTRLGLYFCAMVAELHENRGRQGTIHLANGGTLGGGRFTVLLP